MTSKWLHLYVPGSPNYVYSSSIPSIPFGQFPGEKKQGRLRGEGKPRVLVVDDERLIADSLAEILNLSGFDATPRYGGEDAIAFIHEECPDIVLSDVMMPSTNGLQVAQASWSKCPGTRIVLISGNAATPNLLEHALPDGAPFELLAKPIHPSHLLNILKG